MDKLTKCKTCGGEGVLDNCEGSHIEKCMTCDGAGFLEDVEGQIARIENLLKAQAWSDDITAGLNNQLTALKAQLK